jgi:hypothetical protein
LYPDRRKEETPPPSVTRDAEYKGVLTVIVRPDTAVFAASPPAADAGAGAGAPFAAGAGTGVPAAALSFPAAPGGGGGESEE